MINSYNCFVLEPTAEDPYEPEYMPIGNVFCSAYTFAEAEQIAKNVLSIPCCVWTIKRVLRQHPIRKPYFIPYEKEDKNAD